MRNTLSLSDPQKCPCFSFPHRHTKSGRLGSHRQPAGVTWTQIACSARKAFTHPTLERLSELIPNLVYEQVARLGLTRLTIDLDGTVLRTALPTSRSAALPTEPTNSGSGIQTITTSPS